MGFDRKLRVSISAAFDQAFHKQHVYVIVLFFIYTFPESGTIHVFRHALQNGKKV